MSKAVPFFADAIATVLSCFPLVGFRSKAPRPEGSSTSAWEGARLLFADRRLRVLLLMVGSLAGLQGMEAGVLVLLATTEWGVREGAYGVFLAAGAAGNLIGSLGANRLVRRFGSARTLIGAALDIRRRLPDHGVGSGLAAGRPRLRPGRFRGGRRIRRCDLSSSEADP